MIVSLPTIKYHQPLSNNFFFLFDSDAQYREKYTAGV